MIPKEMKYNLHYGEVGETFYRRPHRWLISRYRIGINQLAPSQSDSDSASLKDEQPFTGSGNSINKESGSGREIRLPAKYNDYML